MAGRRVIFRKGHVAITGTPAAALVPGQPGPPGQGRGVARGKGHGKGRPMGVGQALLVLASGTAGTSHPAGPVPVGTVVDLGASDGINQVRQVNATLTPGDAILVVWGFTSGVDTATVSDSGGNDYTTTAGLGPVGSGQAGWAFASIVNPATFVRVTFGTGHGRDTMRVFRLGGLTSSNRFDQSASASGTNASPNSGPTGALKQGAELAVELTVYSSNPSWTADFAHTFGGYNPSTIFGIGAGWKQTATPAAVTAAPSLGFSANWWCQVLTFRLA